MSERPLMHDDERATDASLVRRLLRAQFPIWAGLDIQPCHTISTDNAIYRLGLDFAARLPRRPGAVAPLLREYAWLPRLAPALPAPTPVPIALGEPSEHYPWP